jgi:hypothetical protein
VRRFLARADPDLRLEVESLSAQDFSKTGELDRRAWIGAAWRTSAGATVSREQFSALFDREARERRSRG